MCDPRLNRVQSLELALLVAEMRGEAQVPPWNGGCQAAGDKPHRFFDGDFRQSWHGARADDFWKLILLTDRFKGAARAPDVSSSAPAVPAFERELYDSRDNRQVAKRRQPISPRSIWIGSGDAD